MDDNVTVLPKLGNRFAKQSKTKLVNDDNIDPDVKRVLNASNPDDLDVIGLQHEPTKEELQSEKNSKDTKNNKGTTSSIWSWVIIVLAFIVVVLVIVIAWYFLKGNTENVKPQPIHNHIIICSSDISLHAFDPHLGHSINFSIIILYTKKHTRICSIHTEEIM